MRTVRVIPCLDVDAGRVVKGVQFTDLFDAGDPVELAARYDAQGADELVFLDITASSDHRRTMVDVVSRTAEVVFIPFTVGGGVRSVDDARLLLRAGADKVGVNTAAVDRPDLIAELADEFGSQCVVVAVDARRQAAGTPDRGGAAWEVFTHGGRTPTGLDALSWAERCAAIGAGEILLTSMDRDGTRDGFDLELTRQVSRALPGAGHRLRRRGQPRPPGRGGRGGSRPTPCWPPPSSTWASSPSARPRSTCRSAGVHGPTRLTAPVAARSPDRSRAGSLRALR